MTSTQPAAQTRAVIYARISKDATGEGAGVDRQVKSCTHLAEAREWNLIMPPLVDNDVSAFNGANRPEFTRLMTLIRERKIDAVLCWHMDRLCRRIAELVEIIKVCRDADVHLSTVHGDLDLSSPIGKMFATILIAVAEYEAEHKGERQVARNEQAARAGKRHGGPRGFGSQPGEADAIKWAADCLLGGGTVSAVAREWSARGLRPPQAPPIGPLPRDAWKRNSVTTILRNPAVAGLRAYLGEVVADGDWAPVLPRETWEAVRALLDASDRTIVDKNGKARRVRIRTERGVRTLGGGLFLCRCGNTLQGNISSAGKHVYRCNAATRGDRPGPHAQSMTGPVDEHVTLRIIARLARPDLADLVTPKRPDLGPLHTEAASIRANLDELAADRALGLVSRAQMIAATQRGNARLAEISARLAAAAESSGLAPFAAGESARKVWDRLDNSRRRAVIAALCTVTLHPAGRGARVFDPDTVTLDPVTP